nr:hypothetical protein [Paenibacillus xylanexedens]
MRKKFSSMLMVLVLSLLLIPTGLVSASDVETSKSQSFTYQSPIVVVDDSSQVPTVTSAPGNDRVEIRATNPFNLDISDPLYGLVTGYWKYDYPGKMVNFVNLTMELQYRSSFLSFNWDTIDSYLFQYGGGLGSHAENQKSFRISEKGQYRVKVSGQVSFVGGHHDILAYSGARSYDGGGIIIADEPESK